MISLAGIDTRVHCGVDTGQQFVAHLGDHVAVGRHLVWPVRADRAPMHQHPWHFRVRHQRGHVGIGAPTGHVVDDLGTVFQRRLRDLGMHGVDADRDALSGKLFDHRQHACGLDSGVDAGGAGAGRLAADVDDRRTLGGQHQTMFDGAVTVEEQSPVGKGVVGDVHDPHHLHASS